LSFTQGVDLIGERGDALALFTESTIGEIALIVGEDEKVRRFE
jgi:hypothetical protein